MTRSLLTLASITLSCACATVPVPLTRFPSSPAHPEALEAVSPPLEPLLGTPTEDAPAPSASEPGAARMDAASGSYDCPMHPDVVRSEPGACPVCGMALRRKPAASKP